MAPARRILFCVLLAAASSGATATIVRADAPVVDVVDVVAEEVQTDIADGSADSTTTTVVASEGPVPEARPDSGARAPGIGPILVPTAGSSFNGAWWLVAFGGLQLIGLFFITRRARARLSTDDAQP